MLRLRHQIFIAVLLLAVSIYGCGDRDDGDYEEVVSAQLGSRLEPGVPVTVQLWGEPSQHVYAGKTGEIISLSVTSNTRGLDPNVRLIGPDGEEAFDDDSGANGNALIQEHLLGSDGEYEVRIETDEDQPGEISVLLSRKGDVEEPTMMVEPVVTDLLTTVEPPGAKD